ncbi:MAG: 4Fe-4S dicluster domain-containing protein [Thiohalomonadaceae bacterium]
MEPALLPRANFDALVQALVEAGYRVFGPTPRAGSVVFDEIASADELPRGHKSEQVPGRYRLAHNGDDRLFDFVHGHESLKRFTFAAEETLWTIRHDGQVSFNANLPDERPTAVIGARACDIAGMRVQERTFVEGPYSSYTDPYFADRRHKLFIVAVNCSTCASTCFCASQGAGPRVKESFDLALTELDGHFLLESGSEAGERIAARIPLEKAQAAHLEQASRQIEQVAQSQTRRIDNDGIYELLFDNLEHPRWDDVAARCLSCANCVMVCPTCFCHRESEVAAMDGLSSQHVRQWDACFTLEHGSTHGARLRPEVKQRYRQWLTHKLGSWWKQFGVSGCVGCGRCITWCPTGIDLTEEAAAIRAQPGLKAT